MVKPSLEAISESENGSFLVRTFEESEFHAPFHFHPEFELTAILKGEGNRFVGNDMSVFNSGDLVLIGSNVPHCWKNTILTEEINARSVVIQFQRDFLGSDFFRKLETARVSRLLNQSFFGIHFYGETAELVTLKMNELSAETDPLKRLINLLDIFSQLSNTKFFKLLNDETIIYEPGTHEHHRLNEVQAFIIENFRNKIGLNQIAEIARMTPNAFCKYYKKMTGKTFSEVIAGYRVNYARQQLINTDKPVSQICFECGYADIAFFHKVFKHTTRFSPLTYRKEYINRLKFQS
ncbi:helix-turn-helix domain-containing protein [Pedobacter sp. HMF7647]|uniref:Helix-turn-helix domain-containing protein n=1 Tax=Hufsiella arboris TaxID=2695275 RepID=A0A7K1YCU8_9SPHI|nr:AraC family transcriptional regulator [Hufsiella arboris]MXV52260.1 helix-turn-helix domain-containing protein [Hufsiella arboris]